MAKKKVSKTKVKEESINPEVLSEGTPEEIVNSEVLEVQNEVQEQAEVENVLPEKEEEKEEVVEKKIIIKKEPLKEGDEVVIEEASIKSYIGVRGTVERFTKGSAIVKTLKGNVTLPCNCLKKG